MCVVAGERSSPSFSTFLITAVYFNCSIEQFDSTVNLPEAPLNPIHQILGESIYQGAEQPALKSPSPPANDPQGFPASTVRLIFSIRLTSIT